MNQTKLTILVSLCSILVSFGNSISAQADTSLPNFSKNCTSPLFNNTSATNTRRIDQAVLSMIEKEDFNLLNFPLFYDGQWIELELEEADVFTDGFVLESSESIERFDYNSKFYRGRIRGMDHSISTVAIFNGQVYIWVSSEDYQFEIFPIDDQYILKEIEELNLASVSCHTPDGELLDLRRQPSQNRDQASCLDIYLEIDHDIYLAHGSDMAMTLAWATSVFNNVATIYENENVPIYLDGSMIHTAPDNYTNDLVASLGEFVSSNSGGINGKIGFLMSGKPMGGGLSHGIGGYCNDLTDYPGPFALAGDMTTADIAYPSYSYNVMIMAHELGHVMGLRHTHACVWNGNNSQIDDCGNVYAADNGNTPEGLSCFDEMNPILPANGTIMSNCHLTNGTSINFALGFGSEPGDVLYYNFINAPCNIGDQCRTIAPINDVCADAIPLELNNTCQFRTYDNFMATASGETPNISCGTIGSQLDLWFSAVIPSSGSITVETGQYTGGLTDMIVQLYSGSCGNLTAIDCDDNGGSGNHALLTITGQTPGDVVLIRIIDNNSDDFGRFNLCVYDASVACHSDFDALVQFYNDMGGSAWTNKNGWEDGAQNMDCDVCQWYGVVCNANDRVTGLNLANNNLVGNLSNALLDLIYLDRINMYNNGIDGSIPTFLKDIILLSYVDLGTNQLTGSIPLLLGNTVNLSTLYLDNNQLTGSLPVTLSIPPIMNLWLNDNDLSGCIPGSFYDFCNRGATVRLEDNTQLPFGGDYMMLCMDSLGADLDMDTYCGGIDDCDDSNATINPDASESCDGIDNDCNGLVDDGIATEANNWLGVNNHWNDPLNWSTGVVPKTCHDVFIQPVTQDSVVILALENAFAASLTIGSQGKLHVQNFSDLTLNEKGGIVNNGEFSLHGVVNVLNPSSANVSISNNGTIAISSSGALITEDCVDRGILNGISGHIENLGRITVDSLISSSGIGIECLGTISNQSLIELMSINGIDVIVRNSGSIQNSESAIINAQ